MYRPWGSLDWVLSLSSKKAWRFIGVIGTEERSLCSWNLCKELRALRSDFLFQVSDKECPKYKSEINKALDSRYTELRNSGGNPEGIVITNLMAELFTIHDLTNRAKGQEDSMILDLTSMPKRFFFPILRSLILDERIKNLIITYTSPHSYTENMLYEDVDSWKNLPGFGSVNDGGENIVVSIGFLAESLRNYISQAGELGEIEFLIPFPGPLGALKRSQRSLLSIEKDQNPNRIRTHLIDAIDMSAAFDRIKSLDEGQSTPIAFAPFGPKPISAAMCLYASINGSSVYYPQPTIYHPKYSSGVKCACPKKATRAYWIKHDGVNLYN